MTANYAERADRNDKSRASAVHFAEPWSQDEVDLLMECWPSLPEPEVAEALGRTIEACRQRFYETRACKPMVVVASKTTTTKTTTTTHYIGLFDDPEDCWWSTSSDDNTGGSHA